MPGRGVAEGGDGRTLAVGRDGRVAAVGGEGRTDGVGIAGRVAPGDWMPPKLGRCTDCGRDTFGMAGRVVGICGRAAGMLGRAAGIWGLEAGICGLAAGVAGRAIAPAGLAMPPAGRPPPRWPAAREPLAPASARAPIISDAIAIRVREFTWSLRSWLRVPADGGRS